MSGVFTKLPAQKPRIDERFFVTQSINGWEAKTRDPSRPPRLRPIEPYSDITELISILKMNDEEFKSLQKAREKAEAKDETNKEKKMGRIIIDLSGEEPIRTRITNQVGTTGKTFVRLQKSKI